MQYILYIYIYMCGLTINTLSYTSILILLGINFVWNTNEAAIFFMKKAQKRVMKKAQEREAACCDPGTGKHPFEDGRCL